MPDSTILILVFLPFIMGIATLFFPSRMGKHFGVWAALTPLTCLIIALTFYLRLSGHGDAFTYALPWIPSLGLSLHFIVDGLSMFFATIISGIGLMVVIYAFFYLEDHEDHQKFYCYLLLFMGSMLGVVSSNNLLLTFVFWELTSLTSFFLIGFWFHKEASRYGATKALVITGLGGLAMLGGFILLNQISQTWNPAGTWIITEFFEHAAEIQAHHLYKPMLVLVFVGCAAKSAQFPFHIWLPNAMEAPTPISAYLHSATMVKAGLFLVARLHPALAGTDFWFYLIATTGMLTMCVGGILAIVQTDLKALLAYSTISQLGMIMCMLGLGTQSGVNGAIVHIANHASYKAALFMCVGIIDHGCGTRDLKYVHGLLKIMPTIFIITLLGCWSMAGLPPMGGFISKEMFYESTLHGLPGTLGKMFPYIAIFGALFTLAYCFKMTRWTFFGKEPHDLPHHPHKPSIGFQTPAWILITIAVLLGITPGFFTKPLNATIVSITHEVSVNEEQTHLAEVEEAKAPHANAHSDTEHHAEATNTEHETPHQETSETTAGHHETNGLYLALWHGVNKPLMMSGATLLIGLLLIVMLRKVIATQEALGAAFPWARVNTIYNGVVFNCDRITKGIYDVFQSGHLHQYLIGIFLFVMASVLGMAFKGGWRPDFSLQGHQFRVVEIVTVCLIFLGIIGTLILKSRIAVILSLGMTGFLMAFFYELIGAPDLALTQYLIETISTILFLLVFWFLPPFFKEKGGRSTHLRDGLIAVGFGAFITVLMYGAIHGHVLDSIFPYYMQGSKLDAGGGNVVNVIIVDYRGFDTLWEISVLSIATIGIFALLKRKGYGKHG